LDAFYSLGGHRKNAADSLADKDPKVIPGAVKLLSGFIPYFKNFANILYLQFRIHQYWMVQPALNFKPIYKFICMARIIQNCIPKLYFENKNYGVPFMFTDIPILLFHMNITVQLFLILVVRPVKLTFLCKRKPK
jgi:hypothetical protein